MSGWSGFTEEDLRRLQDDSPGRDPQRKPRQQGAGSGSTAKQANLQGNRPPRNKPRPIQAQSEPNLPAEQRLSAPKTKTPANRSRKVETVADKKETVTPKPEEDKEAVKDVKEEEQTVEKVEEKEEKGAVELDDAEVVKREMSNLQLFQHQQKQMEELNKQKKALLTDAIKQRRKKAVAEASKLNKLHKELDKLDELLTEDVSKIRDRIEIVSRDYLEAQKRHERAEKEFIESKIDLHQKEELKESLTEHLYTVIHHNEVRKSKKLAEMMEALDLEEAEELAEMVNLTQVPMMTPVSYKKGPKSPVCPSAASPMMGNGVEDAVASGDDGVKSETDGKELTKDAPGDVKMSDGERKGEKEGTEGSGKENKDSQQQVGKQDGEEEKKDALKARGDNNVQSQKNTEKQTVDTKRDESAVLVKPDMSEVNGNVVIEKESQGDADSLKDQVKESDSSQNISTTS